MSERAGPSAVTSESVNASLSASLCTNDRVSEPMMRKLVAVLDAGTTVSWTRGISSIRSSMYD